MNTDGSQDAAIVRRKLPTYQGRPVDEIVAFMGFPMPKPIVGRPQKGKGKWSEIGTFVARLLPGPRGAEGSQKDDVDLAMDA